MGIEKEIWISKFMTIGLLANRAIYCKTDYSDCLYFITFITQGGFLYE